METAWSLTSNVEKTQFFKDPFIKIKTPFTKIKASVQRLGKSIRCYSLPNSRPHLRTWTLLRTSPVAVGWQFSYGSSLVEPLALVSAVASVEVLKSREYSVLGPFSDAMEVVVQTQTTQNPLNENPLNLDPLIKGKTL